MNKISGASIITNFLYKKGHRIISGFSGGAVLPLLNSVQQSDIKFIKNSNEQCSGHFAEGLSKSFNNQKPGIIITTSGPGITNCITPIYDAYSDGVPLIVLSGQVDQKFIGTDAFQEAPAVEATKPFTKLSECIYDINKLEYTLNKAYDLAMSPRFGPVHLDLPKDILISEINMNMNDTYDTYDTNMNMKMNDTYGNKLFHIPMNIPMNIPPIKSYGENMKIDEIGKMINNSKKPIICFGQGANSASKIGNLLCNTYKIPCCTTIHGLGAVSEDYQYSLGMIGMHGSAAANYALQESDLVIGIGNRFDDRTIGNINGYAKNARKDNGGLGIIHVDNSETQIKKVEKLFSSQPNLELTSIKCDANLFMKRIFEKSTYLVKPDWLKTITTLRKNNKFDYEITNKIKVQDVIKNLDTKISDMKLDRSKLLFTTGVGNHQMFTAQFITWTHPNKMLTSGSAGTMGVGLPYALGAQIGNPDKTVICIDGDGSFNMTSSDLQTAVENNIPVKIMIMNDSRQQMVYIWQKLFFDENYIGTVNERNPCYKSLAKAYGVKGIRCDSFEQLDNTIEFMLNYNDGPILCDFVVEPDMCLPLVSPGKSLDEMLLRKDENKNLNLDKSYIPS